MRNIVFAVIAVMVAAVVGLFCWRESVLPDINYVTDVTESGAANHLRLVRIYAADINHDEYQAMLDGIINITDFTEEQRYEAAIAAGEPVFAPTVNLGVNKVGEKFRIDGFVDTEMVQGQTEGRFSLERISLETVLTQGDLSITGVDVHRGDDTTPLALVSTDRQAAFDITDSSLFSVELSGQTGGTVTLQFVYSVKADILVPRTVLEEQVIQLHAVITVNELGRPEVEYVVEPYSSLDDVLA